MSIVNFKIFAEQLSYAIYSQKLALLALRACEPDFASAEEFEFAEIELLCENMHRVARAL